MNKTFTNNYANFYDGLYKDKDYKTECELIESIFQKVAKKPVKSVLDLGCGTGNHVLPLAKKGYHVDGVDRSVSMLKSAKKKLKLSGLKTARFYQGDIRNVALEKTYDSVIMMFAVLGYQLKNDDVDSTFKNARKHIKTGGIFIFDVWYGPAVLVIKPSQQIKMSQIGKGKVIRIADGKLDTLNNTCDVTYHLWYMQKNKLTKEVEETHTMRYFFRTELDYFCKNNGLQLEQLTAFPKIIEKPSVDSWNILGIAKAV